MELQKEGTTKEGNYAIQNHHIRERTPERGQRRKNMEVKKTTEKPVMDRTSTLPAAPVFVVGAGVPVPVEDGGTEDELEPMAFARKASKVFPVVAALTANTIPLVQWLA
jgi:hypothetical protein